MIWSANAPSPGGTADPGLGGCASSSVDARAARSRRTCSARSPAGRSPARLRPASVAAVCGAGGPGVRGSGQYYRVTSRRWGLSLEPPFVFFREASAGELIAREPSAAWMAARAGEVGADRSGQLPGPAGRVGRAAVGAGRPGRATAAPTPGRQLLRCAAPAAPAATAVRCSVSQCRRAVTATTGRPHSAATRPARSTEHHGRATDHDVGSAAGEHAQVEAPGATATVLVPTPPATPTTAGEAPRPPRMSSCLCADQTNDSGMATSRSGVVIEQSLRSRRRRGRAPPCPAVPPPCPPPFPRGPALWSPQCLSLCPRPMRAGTRAVPPRSASSSAGPATRGAVLASSWCRGLRRTATCSRVLEESGASRGERSTSCGCSFRGDRPTSNTSPARLVVLWSDGRRE